MTLQSAMAPVSPKASNRASRHLTVGLLALLIITSLISLSFGASDTGFWTELGLLIRGDPLPQIDRIILFDIRLPRLVTAILVGAALAVSGADMQGLFKNPLADPSIVGVSAGAGLGAITAIVLGAFLPAALLHLAGPYLIALAAFVGGWLSTMILYRIATFGGQTSVATMLLAGLAMAALVNAASGILIFVSDDTQLRDLTFWQLGSLTGSTWTKIYAAGPIIFIALAASITLAPGLNTLALGEAAAMHMGVRVQRLKQIAVFCVAAATGAAVAVSGGIGFVGIIVPHLLRLASGPDHRLLLPNAALLGASLLLAADMLSRSLVAPAELPIGIVTATMGAPVFLYILLRKRISLGL